MSPGGKGWWHARRCRVPHQLDFIGRQAVGGVDEVGDAGFEGLGFGGEGLQGSDGGGVLFLQAAEFGDGQRLGTAAGFLELGGEGGRRGRETGAERGWETGAERRWEGESAEPGAQGVGAEEGFTVDGHGCSRGWLRII